MVLGVSIDDVESHKKFQEAENFGFSLLADIDFTASKVYSGFREDSNVSNRVTFIIDKAGYIRAIDENVDVANHGPDVVKLVEERVTGKIQVGQPAPDFIASDQDSKIYQLNQFKGKQNVVLAFYPKDFTPG